jgi:OmpA-OmpF porin, OOP family
MQFILSPRTAPATSISTNDVLVTITGKVLSENKRPLIAEVSLHDQKGKEIQKTMTDGAGSYFFKTALKKTDLYNITCYHDSYFISTYTISAATAELHQRETLLPELEEGKIFLFENMNFYGGSAELLPASLPSLEALGKLMKKNNYLTIEIAGHVNYQNTGGDPARQLSPQNYGGPAFIKNDRDYCQWLSEERAELVYNYLRTQGIAAERLNRIGYGAKLMLYPDAQTETQMSANRRVEIKITSFKH